MWKMIVSNIDSEISWEESIYSDEELIENIDDETLAVNKAKELIEFYNETCQEGDSKRMLHSVYFFIDEKFRLSDEELLIIDKICETFKKDENGNYYSSVEDDDI